MPVKCQFLPIRFLEYFNLFTLKKTIFYYRGIHWYSVGTELRLRESFRCSLFRLFSTIVVQAVYPSTKIHY